MLGIKNIVSFFQENSTELLALWGAVVTIAYIIVKLTPTKKDDKIFETVFSILKALRLDPNIPDNIREELGQVQAELEDELNEMANDRTRDNIISRLK